MSECSLDLETRSEVDLQDAGVDIYSRHPSTEVLCATYALGDGPVQTWKKGEPEPIALLDHVRGGGIVNAWNASFEMHLWTHVLAARHGWPLLGLEQVRCTMARSYAMSMPGALAKAAPAMGIDQRKDMSGHRLMLQMCKPRGFDSAGKPVWWETPEQMEKLTSYCADDTDTERAMGKRLLPLSAPEQQLWFLDQRINARGIYVDRKAIVAAIAVVEHEQERLKARIREVSLGAVSQPSEVAALTRWVGARGVDCSGLAKADIVDLLADETLPADVRAALVIRQEYAKTSTAKLRTMLATISADGRIKNTKQYHGAGTGRWAGRKLQPDNMPRPTLSQDEIEEVLAFLPKLSAAAAVERIELLYGSPMSVISDCLRGMLMAAEGHDLIGNDFSNIEGRMLAWLAGEEWKLQAFRDFDAGHGHDIYKLAYGRAFHKDPAVVDKSERQVGKVMELALGYGGGVGAFQTMARGYGVKMKDSEADSTKVRWRGAHPAVVNYWYDLERAAIEAVLRPGLVTEAGPRGRAVKFRVKGSFLFALLPSGRMLSYPYPRICEVDTPWGEKKDALTFKAQLDSTARKKAKIVDDPTNQGDWIRIATYGGSIAENVTQAAARDVLAEALVRLEEAKYPVVLHVHDEAVAEVPCGFGSQEEAAAVMAVNPAWCPDLPIAVEGWRGARYRK